MVYMVMKAQQHMQQARSIAMWHMWVQEHSEVGACHILSLPCIIAIVTVDSGAWWALKREGDYVHQQGG